MALRKCCGCKDRFPAESMQKLPAGYFHSTECAISHAQAKQRAAREKAIARQGREVKAREKAFNKETRRRKEKVKTKGEWAKEAQAVFNRYVRLRDKGKPCVSCDKPDNGTHQRHASHFRSVGSCSSLRFNLFNVHASCQQCNTTLSGNIGMYRPRLIEKIGADRVEWIECQNDLVRYDIEYLKRIKGIFTRKTRLAMKKLL